MLKRNGWTRGRIALREWLPVIGLMCCTFVFNTSEFIPIGLLSDIAADFGITEARAGLLITVYAWVVALVSLPLMLARGLSRARPGTCKRLLRVCTYTHPLTSASLGLKSALSRRLLLCRHRGCSCPHLHRRQSCKPRS